MSIGVELEQLREAIGGQAGFAYVLTVSDDGRPHAVALVPLVVGATVQCDAGTRTCANAKARPAVSLLWPPVAVGEYSLIVDGDATVAGGVITVTPTRAVLHRPADCAPVPLDG